MEHATRRTGPKLPATGEGFRLGIDFGTWNTAAFLRRRSWTAGDHGGQCTYTETGVLHVTRSGFDVSGCVSAQYLKDLVLSDPAVEAQFSMARGCGGAHGTPLRTGRVGVGGFAPHPVDAVDATITRYRAWTPTGSGPQE